MKSGRSLDAADAVVAIDAMWNELAGRRAVIVVADVHGDLLALRRVDGAPPSSVTIASNKAWTAAREGTDTLAIGRRIRTGGEDSFDIAYYGDPRYVGWGGGVPVRVDGEVVGSVAVSGLPELEDHAIAVLGAGAIIAPRRG